MYVLLHNRQKRITKLFTLAVFFVGPLVRTYSKNEVMQVWERDGGSNKSVNRLRTFLKVNTNFGNSSSSQFSVLLLRIQLESMRNREECESFSELL